MSSGDDPPPHSSGTPNNNGSGWEELPTELLMMIFNEFRMVKNGVNDLDPILKSRLVHPRWKLVMDELLEKWCLEYWTKWNADEPTHTYQNYNFPRLAIAGESDDVEVNGDMLFYHRLLEENIFPTTKFVRIGDRFRQGVVFGNDFSRYGHHLTSLSFSEIGRRNPLTLSKLARILHLTPNLKAIELEQVVIKREEEGAAEVILLPSLPHLEHVRVRGVNHNSLPAFTHGPALSQFSNIGWLLKPYKTQLVSLQTDECFKWDSNDGPLLAYPNLKRLKVWPPSAELLKAEVGFPSLQCLSLGWMEEEQTTIQLIQNFISHFTTTLTELHLGMRAAWNYGRIGPRTYAENENEDDGDVAFGPPITNLTFPLLKTFAIFYPECDEEVPIVRDFLRMFPALETLKFLLPYGEPEGYEREHMFEQQYWRVCPMLKTIRVQMVGRPHYLIFTMRAPFSS